MVPTAADDPRPPDSPDDAIPQLEDFLAMDDDTYTPYCGTHQAAVLPRGEFLFIHGHPRSLKSWTMLSMCLCIASGLTWLDMFPCERANVLYIQGDGGRFKWRERIQKLMRGIGITTPDIIDSFRTDMRRGRGLSNDGQIHEIIEACDGWVPQVAVFDPLSRFLGPLDENSSHDMSIFVSLLGQLQAVWPECTLTFPHHNTKGSEQRGGAMMRGSGVLWAAGNTCSAANLSKTKSELEFVLKDYESPPSFVVEVEIGTEIATVSYLGTVTDDEKREKLALIIYVVSEAQMPLTFKDIAHASGLSITTVRRLVSEGIEAGFLKETEPIYSGGRPCRAFILA